MQRKLMWRWALIGVVAAAAVYFMVPAASNAFVTLSFDPSTWVDFPPFGMPAITGSFVIGQTLYLARHMRTAEAGSD